MDCENSGGCLFLPVTSPLFPRSSSLRVNIAELRASHLPVPAFDSGYGLICADMAVSGFINFRATCTLACS